ncbi:MAG: DUF4397 domain-containing protein [Bacteroidota bacterium]
MKHFNALKKGLFLLSASAFLLTAKAQTARFQIIHNAADPVLDTVDVYVNGTKWDNIAFRQASSLITVNAGTVLININDKSSVDSSDQVLTRFSKALTANSNTILMVAGVSNTSNFAANPNSVNTAIQLVSKAVTTLAAGSGKVQISFMHGVTDAPSVDIFSRPSPTSGALPTGLLYGQASGTTPVFFDNGTIYAEIRLAGTKNVLKSYTTSLSAFNQQAITVFASGFVDPLANQNGYGMGLFAVDTNGNVVVLKEAARVQLIHNAPDTAIKNVDIYFNDDKLVSNLAFRKATAFFTAEAGAHRIRVANANQTDTIFYIPSVTLFTGKSYVAIATGVKDTTTYAANPEGHDRGFTINGFDSLSEGSTVTGNFQYVVYNGTPDAVDLSFNRISNNTTIISNLAYGKFSNLLNANANFIFNVSNSTQTAYNGAYTLTATGTNLNQSGVIFTSGFYSETGNPVNSPSFKIYVAYNNGTVAELIRLKNKLQIIHNSPDTTIKTIDVYANGVKFVNGLGFRKTTGIAATDAYVPVRLNLTNGGSVDTSNSLWAVSLLPDSNFNIAITHGFTGTAYRANPESISTNFGVTVISPAKQVATLPKPTNEVTFFHGAVNLGKITIQGEQEGLFVAKSNSYKTTYKYSPTKGNAAATYNITDANSGAGISTYKANFVGRTGNTGVLLASGVALDLRTVKVQYKLDSLHTALKDSALNYADSLLYTQNKDILLGYYIVWTDGSVDTLERVRGVGIAEVTKQNELLLYPNPVKETLNVVFTSKSNQEAAINIIDLRGAIVKSEKVNLRNSLNEISLNVSNLNAGIYFVQLTTNEGVVTKKLIVE